jgi:hypothetical protein
MKDRWRTQEIENGTYKKKDAKRGTDRMKKETKRVPKIHSDTTTSRPVCKQRKMMMPSDNFENFSLWLRAEPSTEHNKTNSCTEPRFSSLRTEQPAIL